jgi:hypothetical protein
MKLSEFKSLIREEVKKVLAEAKGFKVGDIVTDHLGDEPYDIKAVFKNKQEALTKLKAKLSPKKFAEMQKEIQAAYEGLYPIDATDDIKPWYWLDGPANMPPYLVPEDWVSKWDDDGDSDEDGYDDTDIKPDTDIKLAVHDYDYDYEKVLPKYTGKKWLWFGCSPDFMQKASSILTKYVKNKNELKKYEDKPNRIEYGAYIDYDTFLKIHTALKNKTQTGWYYYGYEGASPKSRIK